MAHILTRFERFTFNASGFAVGILTFEGNMGNDNKSDNKSDKPTLSIAGQNKSGGDGDSAHELGVTITNVPEKHLKWLLAGMVLCFGAWAAYQYFPKLISEPCELVESQLKTKIAEKEIELTKTANELLTLQEANKQQTGIDYNLSGRYFYITSPQSAKGQIPVPCISPSINKTKSKNNPDALKIGGVVQIDHSKDNNQVIYYLNGRRTVCVDKNRKTISLQNEIAFKSKWVFIRDNTLYSNLEINDGHMGLLETKLPSTHNVNDLELDFSGTMVYYLTSNVNNGEANITDMHFFQCGSESDCNDKLFEKIKKEVNS